MPPAHLRPLSLSPSLFLSSAKGLVELPTGPRHSFHRRIIGSLLTDKHLRVYATTVQEEVEVLLGKWSLASESGATVNAHYDLAMCTEGALLVIVRVELPFVI